jgi:competence ComEA-like helix-hairpin-helix protein
MRRGFGSESNLRGARPARALGIARSSVGIIGFLLLACVTVAVRAEKHPPAKPIDLNAANAKELQELPGVGPVTAKRIIDLREKNGRFKRVEDLLAIRGISQKKLDALRPFVMVAATPSAHGSSAPKTATATKKTSP